MPALLLGAASLFAGCQSQTTPAAPTATPTPEAKSALQLLQDAQAQMQKAGAYHFTMQMNMKMEMGQGMSMDVPITGEGDIAGPDRMRMLMEVKQPISLKLEMVKVDATTYTRMGGAQWQKVDAANSAASEIMPFSPDQLDALARTANGAVEDLGTDDLPNGRARHIRIPLPESAMAGAMNAGLPAGQGMKLNGVKMETWIGEKDALMHRMRMQVDVTPQAPAAGTAAGGMKMSMDMTMDMSDFGKQVDIAAPQGAVPAPARPGLPTR